MAAILGLTSDKIVEVLSTVEGTVEAVNFNEPTQTAIAGEVKAVEAACEALKAAGAKRALILPVSGPFHSSLMKPAGEELKVVLDTRGNLLDENIHNNFLIKPNIKELEEMFEADLDTIDKAVEKCKYFLDKNIKHIIVSMGGKGALYINKDGAYTAQVPKGTLINSVGAGDSMVAGFIAGFELGKKPEEAFKLAVAAGSATAYSYGLGEKDLINKLYNEINIKKEGE